MQDRIFFVSCFGFILGVLLRSFVFVNTYTAILFGVISVFSFLFFILISKDKWGIIITIFCFAFSLGILRFNMADVPAPHTLESQVGQKVSLSGIIADESDMRENSQKLIIRTEVTRILINTNPDEDLKYGDRINFEGVLEKPDNFITDQGKEFDYVNYLRKDGVLYVVNYPEVEVVSRGNGSFIKRGLFLIKAKFLEKINLSIREPESLFMNGLILGEKSSFDESLRQSFVNTGTIHIISLSGYNVTIIAEWIMKVLSPFPKNIGIGFGIFSILLFVLMTGGSSTAVRAGIMATLALFARLTGRNYDVARALILACALMVLINPFVLYFDVSFQLSFIATIAVIFFAPKIEKYFLWVTPRMKLRDIVSVTCAAYTFVLPFILYKMGNLSLVALPANVLILPFIPFTMMFGFFTGLAGVIWYVFAVPFGYISYLMLHYELAVISFFSNIPFASLSIPDFPFVLTLLIYIYFIYRLFGRSIKSFFQEDF